jgi:hypothetical protein
LLPPANRLANQHPDANTSFRLAQKSLPRDEAQKENGRGAIVTLFYDPLFDVNRAVN